jgi:endonuclease V-like protein UPF0215 family
MTLHVEKKAIRALGIAESFREKAKTSTLAGVVMRTDLVIDGFGIGKLTVSGSDATESIASLARALRRNDLNALILSGSVLSLYNIVDVDELCSELSIPVVALTFGKSRANLLQNIEERFPSGIANTKKKLLEKLGSPKKVRLRTGYDVFVRNSGIGESESKRLLDRFTLQGAIPEPIRVARLLAKAVSAESEKW